MNYTTEFFAQLFAILVAAFSLKKKSVSISGFLSMLIVSSVFIWKGGIAPLIILFAMFASASLLTRYKHSYKEVLTGAILKKNGPRDFIQAISNLGVAFFCFLFYTQLNEEVYLLALLSSVASSNADSWASEIGVLSKKKPIMITTFKTCEPGISGGITLMGTMAGIAGSIFIAFLSVLLKPYMSISLEVIPLFLMITVVGIVGLLLDSIFGATIQLTYKDEKGEETENPLPGRLKSRGIQWINNDMVNFLSSLGAALVAVLIYSC
jgi:uncharacterized protein (TIGR00297 family)